MSRRKYTDGTSVVKVLAVEDNPGDLVLVKEYLKAAVLGDYDVSSADTLATAAQKVGANPPDVILLDLNLPDSRGLDTFTGLHAKFPKVPIVVLTGYNDEVMAARAINEGAQDYLFKDDLTSSSLSHAIVYAIERKKIEQELIEEKGRAQLYLDLLTHDINNYITAAMGYLQLAEMRLTLEEKDKKLIGVPIRELRNSSELIANVRNIQRLEVERYRGEEVEIRQMLEGIRNDYEHPHGRDVAITLSGIDRCPMRVSSLLKDAFGNIVGNAIKHSTGPLKINIIVQYEVLNGEDHIRVSIEDNGPGVPDDMKECVFDRMTRGSTKVTGHGLGLYLVKRLVEDQGGQVWVEDRVPGNSAQGAKFVVELGPLAGRDGTAPKE
jgi:signal transduction histidine kinase